VPLTHAVESEEVAELQARNDELQKEISNLSAKLELSRRAIEELEGAGQQDSSSQVDVQRLRDANDSLTREIKELKDHPQTSEAWGSASMAENFEAAEHQRQLRRVIDELQKQLAESQSKVRELENSQQQRANDQSLKAIHADEQRRWEMKIAELERELADARERLGETESLRRRLAESERLRQALDEENRRHEQDIQRWQTCIAEAEENRHPCRTPKAFRRPARETRGDRRTPAAIRGRPRRIRRVNGAARQRSQGHQQRCGADISSKPRRAAGCCKPRRQSRGLRRRRSYR
jgi:chromosome segregation ATPase